MIENETIYWYLLPSLKKTQYPQQWHWHFVRCSGQQIQLCSSHGVALQPSLASADPATADPTLGHFGVWAASCLAAADPTTVVYGQFLGVWGKKLLAADREERTQGCGDLTSNLVGALNISWNIQYRYPHWFNQPREQGSCSPSKLKNSAELKTLPIELQFQIKNRRWRPSWLHISDVFNIDVQV